MKHIVRTGDQRRTVAHIDDDGGVRIVEQDEWTTDNWTDDPETGITLTYRELRELLSAARNYRLLTAQETPR